MNSFTKKLKVETQTREIIDTIENEYSKQARRLEFRDKIALAVYSSILDIKTNSDEEEKIKLEYIDGLNKIICNYEEVKPLIEAYLEKEKSVEK